MPRNRRNQRAGTIYLVVLGTATIVSLLGLSALLMQRVQRQSFSAKADIDQARLNAQAAIRIGMLRVANDPDWRHNYPNGVWEADVAVATGSYTIEGVDPSDGDLTDAPEDPLVLIGTGKQGDAVQKMQITLVPENRGLTCLEVGMQAATDVTFNAASVQCNQTIGANRDMTASISTVRSDVEAGSAVMGGTYIGQRTAGVDAREMPDPGTVFDYYLANGTPIDVLSLPTQFPNVLKNAGFENGVESWEADGGSIVQITSEQLTGQASVRSFNRVSYWNGPEQDITGILKKNTVYEWEAWVKMPIGGSNFRFVFEISGSDSGTSWYVGPSFYTDTVWRRISATGSLPWSGTLNTAMLKVASTSGTAEFYVDDVVMRESGSGRIIYAEVLSPNSNPFGGGTNPQGIYTIDCRGANIMIERSRIVGTLVLLNPGAGSSIREAPIHMAPAVANFPSLMVDGDFTIQSTNAGLAESASNANFNPPSTPYAQLGGDFDRDDTLPSEINGLIYVSGDLSFRNNPVVQGAVVVGETSGSVDIQDSFDLDYQPTCMQNPPPGFSGPEQINILLESATRVVD